MQASVSPFPVTHEVTNQPPPLAGYNAWTGDRVLAAAAKRADAGWIATEATAMGELVGSERMQLLADQANRYGPVLRTHDRFGHRIDSVDFHPAYHELMGLAFGAGLHSLAWTAKKDGAFAARATLNYLWNQGEQGISCPVTMTFAGVKILRNAPALAAQWEPKLTANAYDARPLPVARAGRGPVAAAGPPVAVRRPEPRRRSANGPGRGLAVRGRRPRAGRRRPAHADRGVPAPRGSGPFGRSDAPAIRRTPLTPGFK